MAVAGVEPLLLLRQVFPESRRLSGDERVAFLKTQINIVGDKVTLKGREFDALLETPLHIVEENGNDIALTLGRIGNFVLFFKDTAKHGEYVYEALLAETQYIDVTFCDELQRFLNAQTDTFRSYTLPQAAVSSSVTSGMSANGVPLTGDSKTTDTSKVAKKRKLSETRDSRGEFLADSTETSIAKRSKLNDMSASSDRLSTRTTAIASTAQATGGQLTDPRLRRKRQSALKTAATTVPLALGSGAAMNGRTAVSGLESVSLPFWKSLEDPKPSVDEKWLAMNASQKMSHLQSQIDWTRDYRSQLRDHDTRHSVLVLKRTAVDLEALSDEQSLSGSRSKGSSKSKTRRGMAASSGLQTDVKLIGEEKVRNYYEKIKKLSDILKKKGQVIPLGVSRQSKTEKIFEERRQTRAKPVIVVPRSHSTRLTLNNARQMLESGVFLEPLKAAKVRGTRLTVSRPSQLLPSETALFEVTNDPKPEDWSRVVAIFVLGKQWQFQQWPAGFNTPERLFTKCAGFHLSLIGDTLPPLVKHWNVQLFELPKESRHADSGVQLKFWKDIYGRLRKHPNTKLFF